MHQMSASSVASFFRGNCRNTRKKFGKLCECKSEQILGMSQSANVGSNYATTKISRKVLKWSLNDVSTSTNEKAKDVVQIM